MGDRSVLGAHVEREGADAPFARQAQAACGGCDQRLKEQPVSKKGDSRAASGTPDSLSGYQARHFLWSVTDRVATVTLNRPEKKNPLTFESYADLRDLFRRLQVAPT